MSQALNALWYNAPKERKPMTAISQQQNLDMATPRHLQAVDFWLWAGVRLTAGGFMAGRPAR